MKLMKAASSSRRSSTIRADRTDQTEGDAVSRTGSSRFNEFASFVPSCISTWQNNSCQLHPAEQPTCRRGPLLQALQFVPCWLSSVSTGTIRSAKGRQRPKKTVSESQ